MVVITLVHGTSLLKRDRKRNPLRPADIFVVIHPNPLEKSAVVEHATKGWRDGDQYHLIFDVA